MDFAKQESALRKQGSSTAIGQESEEADADEAAREDVEQETSQELLRGKRHLFLLIAMGVILPAEGNPILVEVQEAVVGDSHAMGIASEITDDVLWSAERWFGVDDPVLAKQRS